LSRFEIYLERRAVRQLERLDRRMRERILKALRMLRDYGFTSSLDVKKMRGYRGHYRLRVGDYRILFEVLESRRIIVYSILHRGRAY